MSKSPKEKITDTEAGKQRQERGQNRRVFFERLRRIFKFVLAMTIFIIALKQRDEIQKVCSAAFDSAMKHLNLSPQLRQKSADYQNQLDDVITN
jgi:hypothetical protein